MVKNENLTEEIKLKWQFLPMTLLADVSDKEDESPIPSVIPEFVVDHCRRLLSIAGTRVCIFYGDIKAGDITLKTGSTINHTGIVRRRGEEHGCHLNSAKLWRKGPERYGLITGFALSHEVWRSHSWLMNAKDQIIETTYPCELYYGVILDTDESEKFCKHVLKEK